MSVDVYLANNVGSFQAPNHYQIANKKNIANASFIRSQKTFSNVLNKENSKINHNLKNREATFEIPNGAAQVKSNNPNNMIRQDGTDLARMNEVAKELTDQLYGFLWTSMAKGVNVNPQGGFGEEMFQKSLWPELVKISRKNQADPLQEAIVKDLIKSESNRFKVK